MTTTPAEGGSVAAVGLAARILLAYADGDHDQVHQMLNADPGAAILALITLAGSLAEHIWEDGTRAALAELAINADLDGLGREVTG